MESIKEFLVEVTQELLYNIVFDAKEIKHNVLRKEFRIKTLCEPMDFFGFGNKTGTAWFQFVEQIPGLEMKDKRKVCTSDGDDNKDGDSDEECIYKIFNTTMLKENGAKGSTISIAKYREMILLECCQIMRNNFRDLANCKDKNGNTPLYYIAALPGITYNCSTLVKSLLQAGVDPLATNVNEQTFLQMILGRFKWIPNEGYFLKAFSGEHMAPTKWFVEDRVALLKLLFEELSPPQTFMLVNTRDCVFRRTAMHVFAISSPIEEQNFDEGEIFKQLTNLGAIVSVLDQSNKSPLHYAFNPQIFNSLMECGLSAGAKDFHGNTPFLYILKTSVELAFNNSFAYRELGIRGSAITTLSKRPIPKTLTVLQNLMQILDRNNCESWNPDQQGNVAINVILIAIKLASYKLEDESYKCQEESDRLKKGSKKFEDEKDLTLLRSSLVELLHEIVRYGRSSELKRQNKRGQGFLHVLLDTRFEYTKHEIIDDAQILQSLEILLKYGAPVNAVDSEGRTPLDITYEHRDKAPDLYKKCKEMLQDNGAIVGNNYSSSLNKTRTLRWCPKRHLNSATRLTQCNNSAVTAIGKYRYLNEESISSGAFSNIFVAIKDEHVDGTSRGNIECRAFALKRLNKSKINPHEIKQEITTLLSVSGECDNIIKYHDSLEDPLFQYIFLDLMDGDLNEFVANEEVNKVLMQDPAIPVQATKEIINGLAYLHKKGFIHRDLKPGNILYITDPTLHFKIADFGLTKNMSTFSTMTSTRGSGVAMAPGTQCWMAPELVSMKSKEHNTESDVFSLGLVLHYLLTLGKHPFATETEERAHVIERNIEMQIHVHNALHPEAISFFQNILKEDPSGRPPVNMLIHHPFLWSESKKIEFLKAVGDQREAENPTTHSNSALEQGLQKTQTGRNLSTAHWNVPIQSLYDEVTKAWKRKSYRTNKLIDLIRFIRNAYAHRQDKSLRVREDLDKNIFLHKYPSLVLDVLDAVQKLGYDETRSNIGEALSLDI